MFLRRLRVAVSVIELWKRRVQRAVKFFRLHKHGQLGEHKLTYSLSLLFQEQARTRSLFFLSLLYCAVDQRIVCYCRFYSLRIAKFGQANNAGKPIEQTHSNKGAGWTKHVLSSKRRRSWSQYVVIPSLRFDVRVGPQ